MPERTCYARGCPETVPSHLLFCPDHWHALPLAMRRRIYDTLAAKNARRIGALRRWVEAIQAARDHLTPAPAPARTPEEACA